MPTRTPQRQLNNVPGIINLPQAKSVDPASSAASSSNRHRSSCRPPVPQPQVEKPTASLDSQLAHPSSGSGEPKRRRRAKKTPAVDSLVPNVDGSLVSSGSTSLPVDENGVDHSTPTKSRRRRGRATRQTSPPLPDSADPLTSGEFSSTTPPQADLPLPGLAHSRSVPPHLPVQAFHHSLSSSSEDEWDMPAVARQSGPTAAQPKEALSWQQELLRTAPNGHASTRSRDQVDSPKTRPSRSRNTVPGASRHGAPKAARPPLQSSQSDTAAPASSGNPALNWQQAMLLSSDLQTSALTDRRVHSSSPTKPSHPQVNSGMTPARQRQHRIKDSITFGLSDLDLSEFDGELEPSHSDVGYQSPVSRHNSTTRRHGHHASTSKGGSRRVSPPAVEFTTPTKTAGAGLEVVGEPRYAGPTFHNSPAPSSLPVPSFVLRRQA
ncbi:hypothetical protein JCM10212_002680 [Sporobolomyces blumeae]